MANYFAPFNQIGATQNAPTPPPVPRLWISPMRIANDIGYTLPYPPATSSGAPAWRYDQATSGREMADLMRQGYANAGMDATAQQQAPVVSSGNVRENNNNAVNYGGGYGGMPYGLSMNDIPQGVDPNWYIAFMAEHPYTTKAGNHINLTPEQVYSRDGEYAIAHALSDKAWGDQFYRTYNRPPTADDWRYSYYDRQRAFYG